MSPASPPTLSSSLHVARRVRELAELAQGTVVDLLVVGLGATGAGAALDAASRGLTVAAIDAHDLAFGTSRWSSKMVHGGLRYLAKGQVGVAYESAVERGALLTRTAPHLVRAAPYLLPLSPSVTRARGSLVMAGYLLGDALRAAAGTPRIALPGPSRVSAARARDLASPLAGGGLRGALLSWDGRLVDDARLVVAVARTAAAHGARVITRCRALRVSGDGAWVRDETTGAEFAIKARAVVNATGVWAGGLVPSVELRPSRGTHLVLRPGTLPGLRTGLHIPIPGESNRFVLVLPQQDGRTYVGLTDEPVDGEIPDIPQIPEQDVTFLLSVVNSVLEAPIRRDRVAGAFAGLRPLLAAGGRTADLSRRHAVLRSRDGVVTVVGGKLTTYRLMAEDAVDVAIRERGLSAGPCRTARLPLVGAPGSARVRAEERTVPRRLVARYGGEAGAVHALERSDPHLGEPVAAGAGITRAELLWAVRHEGALDVADLLDRRTRIGLVPEDRAAAAPAAEEVLRMA
ncbi:glycerol-3-phosphate dehydrogenase [Sinosporangium album]|uniref:Glycerol-3-phosphate dehydrogenase n=1 Tax=Sinosporangium album TaxID=504805 RepID=A0A1G8BPZ5_9ACTN|nr:glycerol-3-phosphate dehydrogenase/oxidase [Sinosporangium album]SDH35118.1 glycerol-3-phosphate dehydrogenase [Sinosporangium album]